MTKIRLAAAVLGALAVSGSQAFAASPMSNAFIANVQANVDFLVASSRLGETKGSTAAIRDFARIEGQDAMRTDNAVAEARPGDSASKLASADTDVLMTGRSVAIDVPVGGPAKSANGRVPMSGSDLAALDRLSGKAFDDALWLKQLDALSQLRADYQAYADDGDDPALGAMAERELPKIEARLRALSAN